MMKQNFQGIGPFMLMRSVLMLATLFISFAALAEYELKDKSEIVGVWEVEGTAPKIDAKKRQSNQEMVFKADGRYISSASDHRVGSTSRFTSESTYEIENGILKVGKPGRVGKFVRFKVYEKEGDTMILKGGIEGFYFLKKK